MATNSNLEVQQSFVAAVFAGDADTLRGLCDPDFELHQGSALPYAGTYRGADGFLAFLGIFAETFDIEQLEPVRIYQVDDPDHLVAEFVFRALVKATGQVYETTLLEYWHFRGGKVLTIKPHYFNSPLHL